MANPNTTSLPAYVEQNRLPLIKETILDAKTARLIRLQSGIKGSAALNLLNTSVVLGDGSACGWNAAGEQSLSQRIINTAALKVNMAYCDKNFLKTWAEYNVRMAAGQKTLPFEEDFINGVIEGVKEQIDALIWNGDTASQDASLDKFDGFFKILANESDVATLSVTSGTYFEAVQKAVLAMPAKARAKKDAVIFCSPEFFANYTQSLVSRNLFHYNGGEGVEEVVIPGTTIRLIAVGGIGATAKLVGGSLENFNYGCDLMGDAETFDFWYSKDTREHRLAIEFNAGVQVAFPDEIVVATYSGLTI